VAFSPDGKLMALEMAPGVMHLKEAATGRTVARLEDPHGDRATWQGFTPDGARLVVVSAYASAIHVWDLRAVRAELAGKKRPVGGMDMWLIFTRDADPTDVQAAIEVHRGTTAETVAAFLPTFSDHDRLKALEALTEVPVLITVGDADRLCPVEHSRALADALPTAELAVYPGAGHMVQMQRRPEVSRRLLALVDRALASAPAAEARTA
jgi:pimeloyl-ACP methyl ester carboxylesterase